MDVRTRIGALAIVAVALSLFLVPAKQAMAAGEYGPFNGSIVYCADYFGATSIQIEAQISRYPGFSWQWIAYSHRLVNVDTGVPTQLTINNSQSYMFKDTHVINSGSPYVPNQNLVWNGLAHGRYKIQTMYFWYSGYWVPSKWVDASFTNTYGVGTTLYCTI